MMMSLGRWLQLPNDELTVTIALRLLAVAVASASITWLVWTRTDPDRVAAAVQRPYAALKIDEGSIHMARQTDTDDLGLSKDHWGLGYTTVVSDKSEHCERIKLIRTLENIDIPGSGVSSVRPSLPIAPVGDQPSMVFNIMPLRGPLPPGRYALALEVTCFAPDDSDILVPYGNPAKSLPICFAIPPMPPGENVDVVLGMPFNCLVPELKPEPRNG